MKRRTRRVLAKTISDLPKLILVALFWTAVCIGLMEYVQRRTPCLAMVIGPDPVEMQVRGALQIAGRTWNQKQVDQLVTALKVCDAQFNVSPRVMLGIILTESEMKIREVSPRNRNGSTDYGLIQQNSDYLEERYAAARKVLDSYDIPYTNDRFDILVNVVSGGWTMADFRKELIDRKVYDPDLHLVAYNVGPSGALMPSRKERRERYLKRFTGYWEQL